MGFFGSSLFVGTGGRGRRSSHKFFKAMINTGGFSESTG